MRYLFGPFAADRNAYRLTRDEVPVELTPKLLDLLFFLLERPSTLVTKDALLDGVWPGANVTDNALAQAMSDLRDALGDRASAPTYIRTIARRGYRFIAPVDVADDTPKPGPTAAPPGAASDTARAIAVLDFTNVTGDAEVAWLSTGIAETVTSDLSALGHFRVIDRWRVVQAARAAGGVHAIGAAVGASLVVTGSFQRMGPHLRITARVLDLDHGIGLADAKVDGALGDVFELQDGIVSAFAHELGVPGVPATGRVGVRETSSLDAYRAFTEGLVKIESLDTDLVPAAMDDFERAIAHDSGYAMAYTGLASAEFIAYETSRTTQTPNVAALRSGIDHARRAIQLDGQLAEAHATLSFLLVSDQAFDEARAAALHAVSLEPESWRHQYRLGHALWGTPRIRAFDRALALYPQFAYASFETAMLLVARGDLEGAERIVRRRLDEQGRQATQADRFPSIGFHWLLGALEAAGGRHDSAIAAFERELAHAARRRLYGPEYQVEALVSRGHSYLELGDAAIALAAFQEAQTHPAGQARAAMGEALALEALGRPEDATAVWRTAARLAAAGSSGQRPHQAAFLAACLSAAQGDAGTTVQQLHACLDAVPPSYLGWTIPIDPLFRPLDRSGVLAPVLARLAERAR
jgi:DNA-binding winged helix-turn-helix (wHTH) protein/tetratricopeptide (TPR) repeat protein